MATVTEIAVFPPDMPQEIPPPGDWLGLITGLHMHLGKIARNLPDPRVIRREKSQAIWTAHVDPVPMMLTAGAGVLDVPQFFRPSLGEYWDVHSVSATGFTAGTVGGWLNLPAAANTAAPQGALRCPFPAAGVQTFGTGNLALKGMSDRLVFIASGITGSVLISMSYTRVAEEYWGDYLL